MTEAEGAADAISATPLRRWCWTFVTRPLPTPEALEEMEAQRLQPDLMASLACLAPVASQPRRIKATWF